MGGAVRRAVWVNPIRSLFPYELATEHTRDTNQASSEQSEGSGFWNRDVSISSADVGNAPAELVGITVDDLSGISGGRVSGVVRTRDVAGKVINQMAWTT